MPRVEKERYDFLLIVPDRALTSTGAGFATAKNGRLAAGNA
jgi:hypothetical protein